MWPILLLSLGKQPQKRPPKQKQQQQKKAQAQRLTQQQRRAEDERKKAQDAEAAVRRHAQEEQRRKQQSEAERRESIVRLPATRSATDIIISYTRADQPEARKLADALEREGWSVWWDPKLRPGEHSDDVIERAVKESKCVVVMWAKLSVKSEYTKAEATYALDQHKLVPVTIENVDLPFRFAGLHTLSLLGWDGSRDFPQFRKLMDDIIRI